MKIVLISVVLFFSFPQFCFAANIEDQLTAKIHLDEFINALPTEVKEDMNEYNVVSEKDIDSTVAHIKNKTVEYIQVQFKSVCRPALQTLIIVMICGIVSAFFSGENSEFSITVIGSVAIAYLCLGDVKSLFSDCVDAIKKMYEFSTVLFPCLAGASVFTGAAVSVGVKYTAAALFMNILLNVCNSLLVPIVSLYLVCMIGYYVFDQPILGAISKFVRWGCLTAITGSMIIFTTYLTVAGLISGANDLLSVRIARTTISNGLPIVGKIISDTASTLIAGASMLRNTVGILGVLATLLIILLPFISIGIRYLIFKAVSQFSEIYPEKRFSGLIKGISEAYGMLFAVIGSGFIMIFMTVLSFMQLVVR